VGGAVVVGGWVVVVVRCVVVVRGGRVVVVVGWVVVVVVVGSVAPVVVAPAAWLRGAALKLSPTAIASSASPDPFVTVPLLSTTCAPGSHRPAFEVGSQLARTTVVPLSRAQRVVVTWVVRFVTAVPAPPSSAAGLQPLIASVCTRVTFRALATDTTFVHSAAAARSAEAKSGTSIRAQPATEIAMRWRVGGRMRVSVGAAV
jgi:hypothetical protein